jgi:hypothetical protein
VYSICHEGVSHPKLLGEGAKRIGWTRRAVQSISNVIKNGIKFFKGHNSDNSTDNRRILGEVVGSSEKEIDGRLHRIVVAYHPPEVREEVKKYDICSQESVWNFVEKSGKLIADSIEELTGIALGSSKEEQPAFEGAVRLGMVQAFGDRVREKTAGEPAVENTGVKTMTFEDVKKAVVDLNIHPSQLFSLEKVKTDYNFSKEFDRVENEVKELKKQTELLTKEKTEKETQLSGLIREKQTATVKTRLSELSKELRLTDKERIFVEKMFKDSVDPTDDGLKKFIDEQRGIFKEVASLAGVPDTNIEFNTGDGKPSGVGETKVDFTDPKNNDLLGE